jgi:D-alanyl-D-alanine carboxypeptidase
MTKISIILSISLAGLLSILLLSCNSVGPVPSSEYNSTSDLDTIVNVNHPKAARYQAFLDSLTRAGMVGVSILVSTPQDGIWAGSSGMADIAAGAPMNPSNLFRVFSITKTFTAVAVLKLVEAEKLSLDDLAQKYLSQSICSNVSNANIATIRQLLNHTSGIRDYNDNLNTYLSEYNGSSSSCTPDWLIKQVYGMSAYFAPGQGWEYSNVNYLLLGKVIEKISGKTFSEYIKESIVAPLHLKNTHVIESTPIGTVKGYVDMNDNGIVEDVTWLWKDFPFNAENGVVADIFDIYIFFNSLFRGNLLDSNSLAVMETLVDRGVNFKHTGYGLGLEQEFSPYGSTLGHGGSERGYRAQAMYFKETDILIIWFSNGPYRNLTSDIAKTAFELSATGRKSFYDLVFE